MKCKYFKMCFGLFALVFSFFFFSSSVNAVNSYTFTYPTDGTLPGNASSAVLYSAYESNPYNFTPKYVSLKIENQPSFICQDSQARTNFYFQFYYPDAAANAQNFNFQSFSYRCPYFYSIFDLSSMLIYVNNLHPDHRYSLRIYNPTSSMNLNHTYEITLYDDFPFSSPSSGTLEITENGEYDVSGYASASVEVPQTITSEGQYHNDLVNIKTSIYVCAAVLLVLYFFYCIYRIIIKGGKL